MNLHDSELRTCPETHGAFALYISRRLRCRGCWLTGGGVFWGADWPFVWPGVARVSSSTEPIRTRSPGLSRTSACAPDAAEITLRHDGTYRFSRPEPVTWSACMWVFTAARGRGMLELREMLLDSLMNGTIYEIWDIIKSKGGRLLFHVHNIQASRTHLIQF